MEEKICVEFKDYPMKERSKWCFKYLIYCTQNAGSTRGAMCASAILVQ